MFPGACQEVLCDSDFFYQQSDMQLQLPSGGASDSPTTMHEIRNCRAASEALGDDLLKHSARDIGESESAPAVKVGQFLVINP